VWNSGLRSAFAAGRIEKNVKSLAAVTGYNQFIEPEVVS
jgi:hypothetical protein